MKTKYFLFIFALAFSQSAFSQNNSTQNSTKAYLFSSGAKSTEMANTKTTDLSGRNGFVSGSTRSRIFRDKAETVKPAANTTATKVLELECRAFELINEQRAKISLKPLDWSEDAAKIARHHSENMANYNFFSHTGLDGSLVNDRADFFGVKKWQAIGENIAYNQGFENPVEFAVERWMLSPKHRENLLNSRWKESGIGIAVTSSGTYYFTEVFLSRN